MANIEIIYDTFIFRTFTSFAKNGQQGRAYTGRTKKKGLLFTECSPRIEWQKAWCSVGGLEVSSTLNRLGALSESVKQSCVSPSSPISQLYILKQPRNFLGGRGKGGKSLEREADVGSLNLWGDKLFPRADSLFSLKGDWHLQHNAIPSVEKLAQKSNSYM